MALLTLVVAAQADEPGAAWGAPFRIKQGPGNLTFRARPSSGSVKFEILGPEAAQKATATITSTACAIAARPDVKPWPASGKLSMEPPLALANEPLTLTVKFRLCFWSVYAANRLIARFPAPFDSPAGFRQPATQAVDTHEGKPFFQRMAPQHFHDDFMIAPGDDAQLSAWNIESGTWKIHSAQADALAEGTTREGRPLRPGHSPNFYSLKGAGRKAVITSGYDFCDHYTVQAAVHTRGGEAGLVFYHRGPRDYYAFTVSADRDLIRPLVARLWRLPQEQDGNRRILAAARIHVVGPQWILLKVKVSPGRVRCSIDNTQVFDLQEEAGIGGKFGLLADSHGGVRFDDVAMESQVDLDLESVRSIRLHAVAEDGQFLSQAKDAMTPKTSRDEQSLIVGSIRHPVHAFSARFRGVEQADVIGLLTAFQGTDSPVFRFIREATPEGERFRLEERGGTGPAVLEESTITARQGDGTTAITLMADSTTEGELRLYRNDELVLVHHPERQPFGASGVLVGPNTKVSISNLKYEFRRQDLYKSRFEKNSLFASDLYMRHWSSPEGEWVRDEEGLLWHKSDFFGRFRLHMPLVSGAGIHLGVPASQTNGAYIVEVEDRKLSLSDGRRELKAVETADDSFDVHYESYWLWVTSGGKPLFKCQLPGPLAGSRIRISGFTLEDLTGSYALRYKVKDYLFTETPSDWIANGGEWQVLNRFRCAPRWSHMSGQSTNGLAAMWTKHRYKGDFCAELYVGTRGTGRHAYQHCGDWNATMMSRHTTPSSGYTVTCTAWDFDLSQRYTTLYREGEVWERSDVYTGPRHRSGNKRKRHHPLVTKGRGVHGAWYYIKLRRIGKRVEYYFDNELIFSRDDEDPIDEGLFGLWTFMNSIVVARVKVAAESIVPQALAFDPLPAGKAEAERAFLSTREWSINDTVGFCRMSEQKDKNGEPYVTVTNTLGGGRMYARRTSPATPCSQIAGWTFLVKRTPKACFNFHYSVGMQNSYGTYKPEKRFFHRLSGTGFSKGEFKMSGHTSVPPLPGGRPDWHRQGEWTQVTVWLPTMGMGRFTWSQDLAARVEGFGNLQPSYVAQGLTGNGPGESYAIKGFAKIPYRPLSPPPRITCSWSDRIPSAIVLKSNAPRRDRAFVSARVLVGTEAVSFPEVRPGERVGILPRKDVFLSSRGDVPVQVGSGTAAITFKLKWKDNPLKQGPVLTKLEGITPLFENFEHRSFGRLLQRDRTRMALMHDDAVQGTYLRVHNTELDQRLHSVFSVPVDVSRYPLLQYRYRASEMPPVSVALGKSHFIHVTENMDTALAARYAPPLRADNKWHVWHGMVADSVGETRFTPSVFSHGNIGLGSFHKVDQTYRYSSWHLDDVILGPAVSSAGQLTFTPQFFDFNGVESVFMAVWSGAAPYDSLGPDEKRKIKWQEIAHRRSATPGLAGVPDGVCRLLLKAVDKQGNTSEVTDIPFLLDTKPLEARAELVESDDPLSNGSLLKLRFKTHDGSPLMLKDLRIKWDDKFHALNTLLNRFSHTPEEDTVVLNWPHVLRDKLNTMADGSKIQVRVTNIHDAAGNAAPDVNIPIAVDFKLDKIGPALLPVEYPGAVLFACFRQGRTGKSAHFSWARTNEVKLHRLWSKEPYVSTVSEEVYGFYWIKFSPKTRAWSLDKHPYLTFRVRRPVMDEDERISVKLHATGKVYEIALTEKPTEHYVDDNAVHIQHTMDWKKNVWQDVVLNTRELLKARGGATGISVRSLWLIRDHARDLVPMDVKDFFVHSKWGQTDLVKLDAYDASGVAGMEWQVVNDKAEVLKSGTTDKLQIAPASLHPQPGEHAWLEVKVRDRTGNLSVPVRMPFPAE